MEAKYFLLGQDAVVVYQENDSVAPLLEGYKGNCDILMIDRETDPYYVMEKVDGWMGWCEITESDYNILYNHLHPVEVEFDFHVDTKHTIWYRSYFSVKAKTKDEAMYKAITMMNDFVRDENSELLIDTTEEMSPIENGGFATEELFVSSDAGDALWKNGL
jgi:hypothetical protein